MILVCYHAEQDALRLYNTVLCGWEDMLDWALPIGSKLDTVIGFGWEVIGEL